MHEIMGPWLFRSRDEVLSRHCSMLCQCESLTRAKLLRILRRKESMCNAWCVVFDNRTMCTLQDAMPPHHEEQMLASSRILLRTYVHTKQSTTKALPCLSPLLQHPFPFHLCLSICTSPPNTHARDKSANSFSMLCSIALINVEYGVNVPSARRMCALTICRPYT